MKTNRLVSFILIFLCMGVMHSYAAKLKDGYIVQGFDKQISGRDTKNESHIPGVNEGMILRTTQENQVIEWESEPVGQQGGELNFAFISALSNMLPGNMSSAYTLYMNGEKLMDFNSKSGEKWSYKGAKNSELFFEQYYNNPRGDRYGYFFLSIPAKHVPKGKSVTFRIEGTPEGEASWLIIYKAKVENDLWASCTSTLLKDSKKQVIKVTYSHYGAPTQAQLELGQTKQNVNLKFGINNLDLPIDPVKTKSTAQLKVTAKGEVTSKDVDLFPNRDWQVNFVQHTHTDIGFTRPQHEILSEHIRFIDYALDYCDLTDDYPEDAKFRWTCETAWSVSEYIRTRPKEQVDRLKKRIKEGRIEVTAMYFNYDELPGEQELAYSLYPLKHFREEGIPVKAAMQNDVNGIAWSFSEFFPDLGVKYVIMGTHGHKALISFDVPTAFWWESPSGKKTLTYRAEHYNYGNFLQIEHGNFDEFEKRTLNYLNELQSKGYPHDIASVQYSGYFTDNSPPSTAGSEMVRMWNDKYEFPKLRMAVASEFMEIVEEKHGNELDTYRAAWPDWWTDGFGSAAREASIYRYAQADVMTNQISLSLAKVMGADVTPTIHHELDEVNKALLFYGEHTFGFHESIRNPFGKETMEQRSHKGAYAWESYRRSRPIGETALGLLQTYVPRNKDKAGIVIFNPLNWSHTGKTTIYADHEVLPIGKKTIIRDENGKEMKKQISRSYTDATYWEMWVEDIPALGSKYYTVEIIDETTQNYVNDKKEISTIENEWYRIKLDAYKGVVTEWFDKELNKNLISDNSEWKMGELIYERDDKRGALDAFKPGNFTRYSPTDVTYEGYLEGDIWDTYRFKGTSPAGMDKDNFTFDIKLYKTTKQVNFTYRLKKKMEPEPEALYVAFPFELDNGKIFFDVPGGTIEAGVEQIPGSTNDWNTVQNFASVRNDKEQIVLGSREIPLMQFGNINLGRFEAGATPETNHIFTWPMNNYWVTNFNADQHGEFEWTYYLTSYSDSSIEHATKFAWGNRLPLLSRVMPAGVSNNKEVLKGSILSLNPSNVALVNMVPVEGENALLLQLREIGGKDSVLDISSPYQNFQVKESDPLGDDQPTGSSLSIKAWENKFVKIVLPNR